MMQPSQEFSHMDTLKLLSLCYSPFSWTINVHGSPWLYYAVQSCCTAQALEGQIWYPIGLFKQFFWYLFDNITMQNGGKFKIIHNSDLPSHINDTKSFCHMPFCHSQFAIWASSPYADSPYISQFAIRRACVRLSYHSSYARALDRRRRRLYC